jgi:hypothetical protein
MDSTSCSDMVLTEARELLVSMTYDVPHAMTGRPFGGESEVLPLALHESSKAITLQAKIPNNYLIKHTVHILT